MYVYYEQTKDPSGKVILTEIVLSSLGCNTAIAWKNAREVQAFELISSLFKSVPLTDRSYDTTTKIWSFFNTRGNSILEGIRVVISNKLAAVTLNERIDLENAAKTSTLHRPYRKPKEEEIKFKEEDFFYAPPSLSSGTPTGELLYTQLASLLQIGVEQFKSTSKVELKRTYRSAAMRLHPDRNNGDGSKMSELNMLWSAYNAE